MLIFRHVKRASAVKRLTPVQTFVPDIAGGLSPDTRSDQARLVGGEVGKTEGFLELFNASSNRWDLVCDNQFSEEVGRVVCRQMGHPSDNR